MNDTRQAPVPVQARQVAGPIRLHVLEIVGNAIVGGMEHHVYDLVRTLVGDQFRFTFLVPFESAFTSRLRDLGCDVFVAPMALDPIWRSIQVASELIRIQQIDLMHAHLAKAHVLAGLVGRLTDTPVLATIHERYANDQQLGIARLTGSHLLTVCQEAYFHALAQGIPRHQLSLIPNGVDTDVFTPGHASGRVRQTLGVPDDAPLVGCVARLSPEKGVDRFVRAAEHVHRKRPDVHFAVIGSGYQHQTLLRLADELGLAGHMHMPGTVMDVASVYPALDLVVQSSRSEGMPLVVLEAMASGRPVVAMSVGGVAEIVEADSTGVLVARNDWQALAAAIVDLLGAPDRMRAMGEAGRRRVEDQFGLRASVQRTAQLFRQLASGRAGSAPAREVRLPDRTPPPLQPTARLDPPGTTGQATPRQPVDAAPVGTSA